MNRADLMATLSQPKFAPLLEDSLNAYGAGDFRMAELKARAILATLPTDPSALFAQGLLLTGPSSVEPFHAPWVASDSAGIPSPQSPPESAAHQPTPSGSTALPGP